MTFEELIADYESGVLHPGDLKPALSKALNKILEVCFHLCSIQILHYASWILGVDSKKYSMF